MKMDSGEMLDLIEEELKAYKNKNVGKKPIMLFDDFDLVLMQEDTKAAAKVLCEWLSELQKKQLASIKFLTSNRKLFRTMHQSTSFDLCCCCTNVLLCFYDALFRRSRLLSRCPRLQRFCSVLRSHYLARTNFPRCCVVVVAGMEKLKECPPLIKDRRKQFKSYLEKYLKENWKDCDFKDDLVTIASKDASDAFRLRSFLENGKKTGEIQNKTLKRKEWFTKFAEMFLHDELIAVDAALRGNLGEGYTVPRLAIVQTTHAVFEAMMERYPDAKKFNHRNGVTYAEVRERTSLSEIEFVEAIEALVVLDQRLVVLVGRNPLAQQHQLITSFSVAGAAYRSGCSGSKRMSLMVSMPPEP